MARKKADSPTEPLKRKGRKETSSDFHRLSTDCTWGINAIATHLSTGRSDWMRQSILHRWRGAGWVCRASSRRGSTRSSCTETLGSACTSHYRQPHWGCRGTESRRSVRSPSSAGAWTVLGRKKRQIEFWTDTHTVHRKTHTTRMRTDTHKRTYALTLKISLKKITVCIVPDSIKYFINVYKWSRTFCKCL